MEKEIDNCTVLGNIKSQSVALPEVFENRSEFVNPFIKMFTEKDIKKVLFFGSGTSYNVSHLAAYYFKHLVKVEAEAQYPTVYMHYENANRYGFLRNDQVLCVGISQSGTSVSTIEMMKEARKRGYSTLAITGNMESEIVKHVDVATKLLVGQELTAVETKGYTVSVLSVYLWALETAHVLHTVSEADYAEQIQSVNRMVCDFENILTASEAWYDRNKAMLLSSERLYVLGYGVDYGSALEGQLKIGEMLRYPVMGYELEEYMHGPTPAIGKKVAYLLIGSEEAEFERMLLIRQALLKYTERVFVISASSAIDNVTKKDILFADGYNKYIAPLAYTVPMQFLGAKGAKDIGIDTNDWPFKEPIAHLHDGSGAGE